MTNIESHKSVAIEIPTYKVLKVIADREFRSPSKQIAALLAQTYPELWEELSQETPEEVIPSEEPYANIIPFEAGLEERSQFRVWQILICLYKNRSLGYLRTSQIASAINYTAGTNLAGVLGRPRDLGLVTGKSISPGARELEFKLTEFGKYVAQDLNEEIPVRLTNTIIDQYREAYLKSA